MAVDDPFPPIEEALIIRLKEMIPEKCPDLDDKDRNQIKINVTFNVRNAPTELQSVGVVLE